MSVLAYTLGLNGNPLTAGLNAAQQAVGRFKSAVGSLMSPLAAVGVSFAAFKSAEGFAESLKGVFDAGRELKTMSAMTGQSVGDLVVLRKAFTDVGLAPDSLTHNLIMLQKSLGGVNEEGQPTAHIFNQLGLSMTALQKMSATEQFAKISTAINKLPNPAQRAAAAMQMFGRSGAEMLALFSNSDAIKQAQGAMGSYAGIMQRNAALFAQISQSLGSLSGKMKGFFVGFADQIGPVLLPLLDKLKTINLVPLGEQIGGVVAKLASAFQSGGLGVIVALSLKAGFAEAANYFIGAMQTSLHILAEVVDRTFSKDFWSGIVDGFTGVGQSITAVLIEAFRTPIIYLQSSVEQIMGKWERLRSAMRIYYADDKDKERVTKEESARLDAIGMRKPESIADIAKRHAQEQIQFGLGDGMTAEELKKSGADYIKSSIQKLQQPLADMGAIITKEIANFKPGTLFDASKILAELQAKLNSIQEAAKTTTSKTANNGADGSAKIDLPHPQAVISDRLSKMGLFIGGGGPAGQRYDQNTANNTKSLLTEAKKQTELWKAHFKDVTKQGSTVF